MQDLPVGINESLSHVSKTFLAFSITLSLISFRVQESKTKGKSACLTPHEKSHVKSYDLKVLIKYLNSLKILALI